MAEIAKKEKGTGETAKKVRFEKRYKWTCRKRNRTMKRSRSCGGGGSAGGG